VEEVTEHVHRICSY